MMFDARHRLATMLYDIVLPLGIPGATSWSQLVLDLPSFPFVQGSVELGLELWIERSKSSKMARVVVGHVRDGLKRRNTSFSESCQMIPQALFATQTIQLRNRLLGVIIEGGQISSPISILQEKRRHTFLVRRASTSFPPGTRGQDITPGSTYKIGNN